MMTCSDLNFEKALAMVKNSRKIAFPNYSFQRQLQQYLILDVKPVI